MTDRTWQGTGGNAAEEPTNWSPSGAPEKGDTLTMTNGTMNVSPGSLADDTLHVNLIGPNPSAGGSATINLSPGVDVSMIAQISGGHLHTHGGTLTFIGHSSFSAFDTVLDSNLNGNAVLSLSGGTAHGETMDVNGRVGEGLTFKFERSGVPDESLNIDRPHAFKALIDLTAFTPDDFAKIGHIGFMGLHATAGDLHNGLLTLTNGDHVVDTVRIQGGANLHLSQTQDGVMLTAGNYSDITPGSVIPLNMA